MSNGETSMEHSEAAAVNLVVILGHLGVILKHPGDILGLPGVVDFTRWGS